MELPAAASSGCSRLLWMLQAVARNTFLCTVNENILNVHKVNRLFPIRNYLERVCVYAHFLLMNTFTFFIVISFPVNLTKLRWFPYLSHFTKLLSLFQFQTTSSGLSHTARITEGIKITVTRPCFILVLRGWKSVSVREDTVKNSRLLEWTPGAGTSWIILDIWPVSQSLFFPFPVLPHSLFIIF